MTAPDNTLSQWQQTFATWLLAEAPQPPVALLRLMNGTGTAPAPLDERSAAGLRLYRNNVVHSLSQALTAQFPAVAALVGPAFFGALARDHVRHAPPEEPALAFYGESLPDFIRHSPACSALPWLADVATLELHCQHALHAADEPVVDMQQLTQLDPLQLADVRLVTGASVRLFRSPFPVARIRTESLRAHPAPLTWQADAVHCMVIYRSALDVQVVDLQPAAFTLMVLLQQQALGPAWSGVAQQFDLDIAEAGPLVAYLVRLGVFSTLTLQPLQEEAP